MTSKLLLVLSFSVGLVTGIAAESYYRSIDKEEEDLRYQV